MPRMRGICSSTCTQPRRRPPRGLPNTGPLPSGSLPYATEHCTEYTLWWRRPTTVLLQHQGGLTALQGMNRNTWKRRTLYSSATQWWFQNTHAKTLKANHTICKEKELEAFQNREASKQHTKGTPAMVKDKLATAVLNNRGLFLSPTESIWQWKGMSFISNSVIQEALCLQRAVSKAATES